MKLLIPLFVALHVSAQNEFDPKNQNHLQESGQMFTVQIIPGEKVSKIYVLGKESAKIKIEDLKIEASVFVGQNEKKLTLERKKDFFSIHSPLKGDKIYLKLKDKNLDKIDEFKIKLVP
ncbi:MAG: hypothetical protein HUU56_13475 [Bdellovibrionaceae bacterium]|nr:hypothetical protein [Pseudobdellovibrionaceae bacterium]